MTDASTKVHADLLYELVSANMAYRETQFWREQYSHKRSEAAKIKRWQLDMEVNAARNRVFNAERAALDYLNPQKED